ncbi:MAG: hypothetical protein ABIO04_08685 [Ferruginibacter sp.]
MKNGLQRFEYYLLKVEGLFSNAIKERNPGLWLYNNDARTSFFMLEGLAKVYAELHNKKRFSKMKEDFKLVEDALGAVDYYDSFAKEFEKKEIVNTAIVEYLHAQSREKIQHLNDILQQRGWVEGSADRLRKIRKKLTDANWLKDEKEVVGIAAFYKDTIKEIKTFASETKCKFTDIETEVHAIRRKLRWLSIYPRALQGMIQLTDRNVADEKVVKYLTDEIVNSAFNVMTDAGNNLYFLMLEKKYFLALSWMISELGKLKDSGLRIMITSEALQQTKSVSQSEALALSYQFLGDEQQKLSSILSRSSEICGNFFAEKNLDKLISGIAFANQSK